MAQIGRISIVLKHKNCDCKDFRGAGIIVHDCNQKEVAKIPIIAHLCKINENEEGICTIWEGTLKCNFDVEYPKVTVYCYALYSGFCREYRDPKQLTLKVFLSDEDTVPADEINLSTCEKITNGSCSDKLRDLLMKHFGFSCEQSEDPCEISKIRIALGGAKIALNDPAFIAQYEANPLIFEQYELAIRELEHFKTQHKAHIIEVDRLNKEIEGLKDDYTLIVKQNKLFLAALGPKTLYRNF